MSSKKIMQCLLSKTEIFWRVTSVIPERDDALLHVQDASSQLLLFSSA